jgi:hypothetical protein
MPRTLATIQMVSALHIYTGVGVAESEHPFFLDDFKVTLVMDGDGRVRELHVVPRPGRPAASITARWLHRELKLGERADVMATEAAQNAADDAVRNASEDPDLRYALLARAYLALIEAGHPKPSRALAEGLGISLTALRQRIAAARTRGLLSETVKGTGGGQLTTKAKRLLSRYQSKGS